MTQIDISTAAILARAEHIEQCAMGTHLQDALRMRALAFERDRLAMQLEDAARKSIEQGAARIGKKNSGRLVDGVEWNEVPHGRHERGGETNACSSRN